MSKAAEYAIYQAEREKLFTKPSGLAFVWGKIVKEWLDVLIDEKAIENNRNTGIDPPYLPLFTDFSLLVN